MEFLSQAAKTERKKEREKEKGGGEGVVLQYLLWLGSCIDTGNT